MRKERPRLFRDSNPNKLSDDYEIHEDVGKGSTSITRRGVHKKTGQQVGIKEISSLQISPQVLERQIVVLRKIVECPKVVKLLDVYEDNSKLCIVFDLVPGGDLMQKITAKRNFEEAEAKHIVHAVTEAIAFCHRNKILHRNIKVESIFCGKNFSKNSGDVYLGSFGRATVVEPGQTINDWSSSTSYKAPEHIQRKPIGYPSDCWALGVVTYIILGGYKPFDTVERDAPPLRTQILTGRVVFHEQEWKDISDTAKDFIRKLLKPDEKARMTAEQALVHPFLENLHSENHPSPPTRPRKASFRQINFVPPQRKSILITPSTASPPSPERLNLEAFEPALSIESLMSSLDSPSSPSSPSASAAITITPTPSATAGGLSSTSPTTEEGSSSLSPRSHLAAMKTHKSRVVSLSLNDKFFLGLEELKQGVADVRNDCHDVKAQLQTLLQELSEVCEEGEKYTKLYGTRL